MNDTLMGDALEPNSSAAAPTPQATAKRVLHFRKCIQCRKDKKKCLPTSRIWPGQKCERCAERNWSCSDNFSVGEQCGPTTISDPEPAGQADSQRYEEQFDAYVKLNTALNKAYWSVWHHVQHTCLPLMASPVDISVRSTIHNIISSLYDEAEDIFEDCILLIGLACHRSITFILLSLLADILHIGRACGCGIGDCPGFLSTRLEVRFNSDLPSLLEKAETCGNLAFVSILQELLALSHPGEQEKRRERLTQHSKVLDYLAACRHQRSSESNTPAQPLLDSHQFKFLYIFAIVTLRELDIQPCDTWAYQSDFLGRSLLQITLDYKDSRYQMRLKKFLTYSSINHTDAFGRTALHVAKIEPEIRNSLASLGADLNIKDKRQRTPLHWAALRGDLQSLMEHWKECAPNTVPEQLYYREVAPDDGPDLSVRSVPVSLLNSEDDEGRTALSLAAERGQLQAVQWLIGREGIDAVAQCALGRTPAAWAVERNRCDVLQELCAWSLKADCAPLTLDARDKNGKSALFNAVVQGKAKCVKILLRTGQVDVHQKDHTGASPYDVASALARGSRIRNLMIPDKQPQDLTHHEEPGFQTFNELFHDRMSISGSTASLSPSGLPYTSQQRVERKLRPYFRAKMSSPGKSLSPLNPAFVGLGTSQKMSGVMDEDLFNIE